MKSYFDQLSEELNEIDLLFREFLKGISIRQFRNDTYSGVFILTHEFFYNTDISESQRKQQIALLNKYSQWEEHFNLLTDAMPEDISKEIASGEKDIRELIELKSGWGTKATIDENIQDNTKILDRLKEILRLLSKEEAVVLIPDTNALILDPDFGAYRNIGGNTITILLSPTVLSELDKLKISHRDESFRNKVDSIIRRIKGLRTQGSLINGVIVDKSISIRMSPKEPNFEKTLSWLDLENNDDRIIAFSLECLRDNPAQKVVLVTTDINLQNKAEMAKLPFSEPPSKM